MLADAKQVKNLPGRLKRDPADSRWLAACFERGAITACFVATPEFRIIRLHTRYRRDLTEERTQEKQRAEKLLESAATYPATKQSQPVFRRIVQRQALCLRCPLGEFIPGSGRKREAQAGQKAQVRWLCLIGWHPLSRGDGADQAECGSSDRQRVV